MTTRSLVLAMVFAGACSSPTLPPSAGCNAPDLAGVDAYRNPSCGASSPDGGACSWSCFYSSARGYEWQAACCAPPCGPLDAGDPCAWRCTFDPRAGGSYQWERLYAGCT